jgi:hypothetical protein
MNVSEIKVYPTNSVKIYELEFGEFRMQDFGWIKIPTLQLNVVSKDNPNTTFVLGYLMPTQNKKQFAIFGNYDGTGRLTGSAPSGMPFDFTNIQKLGDKYITKYILSTFIFDAINSSIKYNENLLKGISEKNKKFFKNDIDNLIDSISGENHDIEVAIKLPVNRQGCSGSSINFEKFIYSCYKGMVLENSFEFDEEEINNIEKGIY